MANRRTLHMNSIGEFKDWLVKDGWELHEPKGIWEVIRAKKGTRIFLAFRKKEAKEHLSTSDKDNDVVMEFINSKKKQKTNYDRIREMSEEELAEFLLKVNCSYSEPCMMGFGDCKYEDYPNHDKGCKDCFLEWLQKESEE